MSTRVRRAAIAMNSLFAFVSFVITSSSVNAAVNGYGSDFVFPAPPSNSTVKLLFPPGIKVLFFREATVCFFAYIEKNPSKEVYVFFAFNDEDDMRSIKVIVDKNRLVSFIVGENVIVFSGNQKYDKWQHFCFTMSAIIGRVIYYLNGKDQKVAHNTFSYKNRPKNGGGQLVLGQTYDQGLETPNSYNEEFGFQGRITQVNVWNRTLLATEITAVNNVYLRGNLVDWKTAVWELNGGVHQQLTTAPVTSSLMKKVEMFERAEREFQVKDQDVSTEI